MQVGHRLRRPWAARRVPQLRPDTERRRLLACWLCGAWGAVRACRRRYEQHCDSVRSSKFTVAGSHSSLHTNRYRVFGRNISFRGLKGTVQAPGSIDCRKGNPCELSFENVQLKTTRPWTCGNALITSTGTVVPAIPTCPSGPNDNAPPRPPPPHPPPHHCTKAKDVGCYNDSTFLALPHYQPQVHDKVTFESCAFACSSFGSEALAGIDAGNHCYCGKVVAAGASAYSRPMTECQTSSCHADPTEKGCGGVHRMLVYAIECKKAT